MKLQKLGGIAAIASMFTYIVYVAYIRRMHASVDSTDPAQLMAAALASPGAVPVYNILIILYFIFFLVMFLALHERMHTGAPYLSRLMLIAMSAAVAISITETIVNLVGIGMIAPTRDLSAFNALWVISVGLLVAVQHLTAWAALLLGCTILKSWSFSQGLGRLFVILGILRVPYTILQQSGPSDLSLMAPIILIMYGTAFIWIAVAMLRQKPSPPADRETVASTGILST